MAQGPTRRMSARITGSVFERWRRAAGVMGLSPQPVERYRALDALELVEPHVLEEDVAAEALARLSREHDLAALRLCGEPRGDIGRHARSRISPARPCPPLDLGHAQECRARSDAD